MANEIRVICVNVTNNTQLESAVRSPDLGEVVYNPDTGEFAIGDGARSYDALPKFVPGQGLSEDLAVLFSQHIANTDIHVTLAWTTNVDQSIANLIAFCQRTDIFVTPEQKTAWDKAVQDALAALALAQTNAGDINDINGRLAQVEDSLYSNITANPFYVSFGSLSGLAVIAGVWNSTLQRIEC